MVLEGETVACDPIGVGDGVYYMWVINFLTETVCPLDVTARQEEVCARESLL